MFRHCFQFVVFLAGCVASLAAAPLVLDTPARQGEANRDAWQRVPDIFAAMNLRGMRRNDPEAPGAAD